MTGKELASAKQEIDKFLLNIDCLDALNCGSDIPNVFDVLRISRNEIRHSNILAWLLDSSGNHGLEDSFIREFVKSIIKSNPQKEYPVHDWLLADYTKSRVIREWHHRRDEEKKKTNIPSPIKNRKIKKLIARKRKIEYFASFFVNAYLICLIMFSSCSFFIFSYSCI